MPKEVIQIKKNSCVATVPAAKLADWEKRGWARLDAVKPAKKPKDLQDK